MPFSPIRWVRNLFQGGEMDCAEVQSLSSDYVDGTMKESISSNFRRHLDTCENCNAFVATFRATVLTMRDLPRRQAPPGLWDKVNEQIRLASASEESEGDGLPPAAPPSPPAIPPLSRNP